MSDTCVLPSQKTIHQNAILHGWHSPDPGLPATLLLIHSEVSEACEAAREGNMLQVEEELADVILRVMDCAGQYGLKMEEAVWRKHRENMERPYRHGGKQF